MRKTLPQLLRNIRACTHCTDALPCGPRPVLQAHTRRGYALLARRPVERCIIVSYETIRRPVHHFGPMIAADLRKRRPKPYTTWHLDEVYLKIDGRMVYLWRTSGKAPECDQEFSRQRHDHGLTGAPRVLGAEAEPLGQSTVLLKDQEAPGNLNHATAHTSVARLGQARRAPSRRVNDVSFDTTGPQPARQPESVATSLKGHGKT